MTPDTVAQSIPFAAWEQAVFVALFIVFVVVIFALLLKGLSLVRGIVSSTNDSFQAFILKRDEQWQRYLSEMREADRQADEAQNKAFAERNAGVIENLKSVNENMRALTDAINTMREFDAVHHTAMRSEER